MSVNFPIDDPNITSEVDGLKTIVTASGNVKNTEMEAGGQVEFQTDAKVTNLKVDPIDSKTPYYLELDTTPAEPSARSLRSEAGLFKKASITGSKKGDSVKFTGKTTVQRASLDMGKGADTVVFGAKTQFIKTTTIDLGPAGGKADKVAFKGKNIAEGGRVVIENFDSKDKRLLNGQVFKQSDLEDGVKIDGTSIKIEFAD